MRRYRILKTFDGSQHGLVTETFVAGTECDLSDDLAKVVLPQGWVVLLGEEQPVLAEDRETKVVAVEETKVEEPEEAKTEQAEVTEDKPKKKKK